MSTVSECIYGEDTADTSSSSHTVTDASNSAQCFASSLPKKAPSSGHEFDFVETAALAASTQDTAEQDALFSLTDDEDQRRRSDRIRAKGKNIDYSQLFSAERFGLVVRSEQDIDCDGNAVNMDEEYDELLFDDPRQRVFEEFNLSDGEEEYKPELDDEAPTSEDDGDVQSDEGNNGFGGKQNSVFTFPGAAAHATTTSSGTCYLPPVRGTRGRGRGRGGRGGAALASAVAEADKLSKRSVSTACERRRGQPGQGLIKQTAAGSAAVCQQNYSLWNTQPHNTSSTTASAYTTHPYYSVPQHPYAHTGCDAAVASGSQQQYDSCFASTGAQQFYPQFYTLPQQPHLLHHQNQVGECNAYGCPCRSATAQTCLDIHAAHTGSSSLLATATRREASEDFSVLNKEDDDNDDDGDGEFSSTRGGGPRKRRKRGGGGGGGTGGTDRSEHNRKERIRRAFITKRVLDCWQYVVAAAEQHGGGRDFTRYAPKLDKIRLVSFITAFLDAMKEQMDEFYGPHAWINMQKMANQRALSLGDIDGNIALLRELEAFDSETAKKMLKTMQQRAQQDSTSTS